MAHYSGTIFIVLRKKLNVEHVRQRCTSQCTAPPEEIPSGVLCSSQASLRPVHICLTTYETKAHEKVNSWSVPL